MADLDMPGCDSKAKEIPIVQVNGIGRTLEIDEVNDEGKTQSNASVGSWLIQLKGTFNPPSKMWQVSKNVCIYRVIKRMMVSNPENYAPFVISFGPYHHQKNPQLFTMDQSKLEAIRRMLTRLKIDVTSLIGVIQRLDSKIRECYAEPIEMDAETLSWMLAMDACFILEFLKSYALAREESDTDCFSLVFQNKDFENSMFGGILDDIMKLENQIPLFVLIALLQLEFGTRTLAIAELAALLSTYKVFCGFPFSSSLPGNAELTLKKYINNDPCHLLDLYRMMIKNLLSHSNLESACPVEQDGCGGTHNINGKRRRYGWWMNMTLPGWMQQLSFIDIASPDESCSTLCPKSPDDSRSTLTVELLYGAGIKFQPGKIGFEKRRFRSSLLSLPQIQVWDNTETLLRNLMAYEECQRCSWSPQETIISHYVHLFKDLIDSEKDVYLLRKSQVIWNFVGSDEDMVRMFKHLTDGITFHSIQEIEVVMKEAREHYNSQWNVWMSQFKKEHCSKPWYILSLVVATFILGMTAVQCIYSVKK